MTTPVTTALGRPARAVHIEGEYAYDDAGKRVGEPKNLKALSEDERLSTLGSVLLRNRAATPEGRRVLLDLAPSDVSTPATVAEFGMMVDGCVGDEISAPLFVPHASGVWYVENVGDIVRVATAESVGMGDAGDVNPSFTPTTFTTTAHALRARLPREVAGNADFDLKARATRFIIEALRIRREVRLTNSYLKSTSWAAANQITPQGDWKVGPTADPLTDLFAALQASQMPANVLVMPENVAPFFHADKAGRVAPYVMGGGQLPRVLYARAKITGGGVSTYAWAPWKNPQTAGGSTSVNLLLLRVVPGSDGLQSLRTFRWLGDSKDGLRKEGVLVRSFVTVDRRDEFVAVAYNDADQILSNTVGAIIVGAVS